MRNFGIQTTLFLGLGLLASAISAQDFEQASSAAETKLQDAVERLAAVRAEIREEKVPLSSRRETLFTELQSIRQEANRAQRLSDNQSADLSALRERIEAQGEVVDYLVNLSAEFARTFDSQLDPSEAGRYRDLIQSAESAGEDPYLEPLEQLQAQTAVLEAAFERAQGLIGGATYSGQAVMPDGLFEEGTFARFGPATYFASSGGRAGLSQRGQALDPTIVPVAGGTYDSNIQSLAAGETAVVPTDPTLGNAMAIEATRETIGEHIAKGGIWIYPILAFAGLSLAVALFKAFEIFSLPTPKKGTLGDILSRLDEGKTEEAAAIARDAPGPIGRMLQQGVRYSKHDPDLVEEILYESVVETQPRVMRLLAFISVTAAVAPLLGLLGTVTGMINTFNRIQIFGTGDAKSLSGGISEALITTEFGLIVAIPSLLLYAFLSRKAKSYLSRMEKTSISFVNGLKAMREDGMEVPVRKSTATAPAQA